MDGVKYRRFPKTRLDILAMEGCGRRRPSTGDRRGPTTTMTMTHIAAAFGAAVFAATAPAVGLAQLIVKPAPTAKVDQGGATKPVNLLSATRHRPRLKRRAAMDAAGCDAGSFGIPALRRAGKHQRARTGARSAAIGGGNIRHATEPRRRWTGCPTAGHSEPGQEFASKRRPTLGCRYRSRPATRH